MNAGPTALMRIPRAPYSHATVFVSPTTRCFAATYGAADPVAAPGHQRRFAGETLRYDLLPRLLRRWYNSHVSQSRFSRPSAAGFQHVEDFHGLAKLPIDQPPPVFRAESLS